MEHSHDTSNSLQILKAQEPLPDSVEMNSTQPKTNPQHKAMATVLTRLEILSYLATRWLDDLHRNDLQTSRLATMTSHITNDRPTRLCIPGKCYMLSWGSSRPGIRVWSWSSRVQGRVGWGFSEQVAAPTQLLRPVFSDR